MNDARVEFQTALDMARRGREAWLEEPNKSNFLVWRDATAAAARWHQELRLAGEEDEAFSDDELETVLAS